MVNRKKRLEGFQGFFKTTFETLSGYITLSSV